MALVHGVRGDKSPAVRFYELVPDDVDPQKGRYLQKLLPNENLRYYAEIITLIVVGAWEREKPVDTTLNS